MTEEQLILIDILKIVPDNSVCYIVAPSINNNSTVLKLLTLTGNNNWQLSLSADNKEKLIEIINFESIQDYFHRLDIYQEGLHLCESYDGMCTVMILEEAIVPNWFKDKYIQNGECWTMK